MGKGASRTICILRFGPLTEILLAVPVACSLKEACPGFRIIWLSDEAGEDILEDAACVDTLIIWGRKTWVRDFPYPHRTLPVVWEVCSTLCRLRREKIDIVLDLEGSKMSRLLGRWLCKTERDTMDCQDIGTKGTVYLPTACHEEGVHIIERNLSVLKQLGIQGKGDVRNLAIPEDFGNRARDFLKTKAPLPGRPVVGIYASAESENRRWDVRFFASLADRLQEDLGVNPLLLWFPGELNMIKAIERAMETRSFRAFPAKGKEMFALVKGCSLLISGDSPLIPIANSARVPVLGLFGPSSPEERGPRGCSDRVIQADMMCVPCDRAYCSNPLCMQTIGVGDVFDIATDMIRGEEA